MLFIQYPPCTTCQKAKKWLDAHEVAYTARHIKEENPSYEEDIAYLEQLASSYRTGIAGTDTNEEAALLQQELDDLESFIGQYRENAVWLASEASIAEYRALSAQMVPAPTVPEFLNETDAVQQFLAGIISADQFAATLKLYLAGND